jgi:hypothetical protein
MQLTGDCAHGRQPSQSRHNRVGARRELQTGDERRSAPSLPLEATRVRRYKRMISRRLWPFSTFFTPFLSHKSLISRRLRRFARNNSQAKPASNETDQKEFLTTNGHELTRMGGGKIGNILPKAGPFGIGPAVGLSDSIPLGLADATKRRWLISSPSVGKSRIMSHYVGFEMAVCCLGETPKRTRETRMLPGTVAHSTQVVDFPRIRMRKVVKGLTEATGLPNLPCDAVGPSGRRLRGFSTGCARGFRDRTGRATKTNRKEINYEASFCCG